MNTTVMASFDTVDGAAQAASDIRSRCSHIKSVKIKSHSIRTGPENISLWGVGAMYANQPGLPYLQNNGLLPAPMAIPVPEPVYNNEYSDVRHATLEVVTPENDANMVCSTIRQDGGVSVKTFPGEKH